MADHRLFAPPPFGATLLCALCAAVLLAGAGAAAAPDPEPAWAAARKASYRKVLAGTPCEVLVLPFQVEGQGVDRPARALMARYLAERIRRSTGLVVANSTLVARALGDSARTLIAAEVDGLVRDLHPAMVIEGFAGHDGRGELSVSLRVFEKAGTAPITTSGRAARVTLPALPFSDECPPEEAFLLALDDVMARLPFEGAWKPKPEAAAGEVPALPESPLALVGTKDPSPAGSAFRLQLLGALCPEAGPEREGLFERSLVGLLFAPESRETKLLKARAYAALHRRPAAVAALGEPATAEEKALAAVLDGNLPVAEAETAKISARVPRLLAEIELQDLRSRYDYLSKGRIDAERLEREWGKAWAPLVVRRFEAENDWAVQSNLLVKRALDEAFPIPGSTAEALAAARLTLGESPVDGEEIQTSVLRHVRRVLAEKRSALFAAEERALAPGDYLEFFAATGDSNTTRQIWRAVQIHRSPESAQQFLEMSETAYAGYPDYTALRALTNARLAERRPEGSREKLLEDARTLARQAYAWAGGQNVASSRALEALKPEDEPSDYDADLPRRDAWRFPKGKAPVFLKAKLTGRNAVALVAEAKKLENVEARLLYTTTNFRAFRYYYEQVEKALGPSAAQKFLQASEGRFAGHPERASFLAELRERQGDPAAAVSVLQEAIRVTPGVWAPYLALGRRLLGRGEFDAAFQALRTYPPFEEEKPVHAVALANYADDAADEFWWRGREDLAEPFLKLAAGSDTGAGAEFVSAYRLLLREKEYALAASVSLRNAKRYNAGNAFRDYLSLLHAFGMGPAAWPVFDAAVARIPESPIWTAALVGHRVEGRSDDEVAEWFGRETLKKAAKAELLAHRFLTELVLDRRPDSGVAARLRVLGAEAEPAALYAEALTLLVAARFGEASELLAKNAKRFGKPYLADAVRLRAWATAEAGRPDQALGDLESTKADDRLVAYRAGRALALGAKGDPGGALQELKLASYANEPPTEECVVSPWYALVETAEELYAKTKDARFRDLALEWARAHQRIVPAHAWAHAVEARYAEDPAARRRALGTALFLDRRSERLGAFSQAEKRESQEWFERNNPFKASLERARARATDI